MAEKIGVSILYVFYSLILLTGLTLITVASAKTIIRFTQIERMFRAEGIRKESARVTGAWKYRSGKSNSYCASVQFETAGNISVHVEDIGLLAYWRCCRAMKHQTCVTIYYRPALIQYLHQKTVGYERGDFIIIRNRISYFWRKLFWVLFEIAFLTLVIWEFYDLFL